MRRIRRKIVQSWKTKQLPELIQNNISTTRRINSNYEYELSDDEDCRKFLLHHFGQRYVDAFDDLLPGAFKCDFWRYAKLYIEGGIYMDLDMRPVVPFDTMVRDNDEFVSVIDRKVYTPPCAIYQAFIASVPRHPILRYALDICLQNIENRIKADYALDITGPVVMGRAYNLFRLGRPSTDNVEAGTYPGMSGTIRFFINREDNNTVDVNGSIFIQNKVDGYMNVLNEYYGDTTHYYRDRHDLVCYV